MAENNNRSNLGPLAAAALAVSSPAGGAVSPEAAVARQMADTIIHNEQNMLRENADPKATRIFHQQGAPVFRDQGIVTAGVAWDNNPNDAIANPKGEVSERFNLIGLQKQGVDPRAVALSIQAYTVALVSMRDTLGMAVESGVTGEALTRMRDAAADKYVAETAKAPVKPDAERITKAEDKPLPLDAVTIRRSPSSGPGVI